MTESTSWMDDAACASVSPEVADYFYSSNPEEKAQAKEICASCPVKDLCLKNALDDEQVWGIWGGVDEQELRRVQSVDINGKPHVNPSNKPIRCPKCGLRSTRFLAVLEHKRTRTHIECTNCQLDWWVKRSVNKKKWNF